MSLGRLGFGGTARGAAASELAKPQGLSTAVWNKGEQGTADAWPWDAERRCRAGTAGTRALGYLQWYNLGQVTLSKPPFPHLEKKKISRN